MANFIRVKIRRGSTSDWAASNPVLALGEIALDMDKHRLKVGNGSSRWAELPFCPVIINDLVTGGVDAALSAEQGKLLKLELDDKASKDDLDALEESVQNIISTGGIVAIDNLNSDDTVNALSAKQGKVLNEKLADKADKSELEDLREELKGIIISGGIEIVDNCNDSTGSTKALSAKQGYLLNETIKSMKDTVDGLGIFGMGYTIDSFNSSGKPTKITFEDGVVCNLNWVSSILRTITADTGEVLTINYDANGRITGRTITRP